MIRRWLRSIRAFVLIMAVMSCGRASAGDRPLFRLLSPAQTGVTFANTIATTDSVNVQTDVYLYNGGGDAGGGDGKHGPPGNFFSGGKGLRAPGLYKRKQAVGGNNEED